MNTNWSRTLGRPSLVPAALAGLTLLVCGPAPAKKAPSVRTPVIQHPTIPIGEKRLALVKFDALSPAWSPDGKTVAFIERTGTGRAGNVWLASLSGSLRRLTSAGVDGAPSWTVDGRLVVARVAGDRFSFQVLNTVNGKASPLVSGRTFPVAGRDQVPSAVTFSPDGTRIAFDLCRAGETFDESGHILIVNLKTKQVEDLKTPPKSVTSHPSWSPDGRLIAYQRLPKGWYYNRTGDDSYTQVWVTDVRTGDVKQVSTPEKEMNFVSPTWCPGGQFLAVEKWLVSMKRESKRETWLLNAKDTAAGALLFPERRGVGGLEWAPDGKHYVYIESMAMNGKFFNNIQAGVVSAQQRKTALTVPVATSVARVPPSAQ